MTKQFNESHFVHKVITVSGYLNTLSKSVLAYLLPSLTLAPIASAQVLGGDNDPLRNRYDIPSQDTQSRASEDDRVKQALGVEQSEATPAPTSQSEFQFSDLELAEAPESPFVDPDIIYLEADTLINDEEAQTLTAIGQVEGRYQNRILRADRVIYNLETGQMIAQGNVTLIEDSLNIQYADTLEISSELEAGTAENFTSRSANGAISGAQFARRRADGSIELTKTYYTACEACEDENPTWQLRARRVVQDEKLNLIRYRDAYFQLKGIPIFYTPYLSHPDPTADRANGFLTPFVGLSNSKGFNVRAPYFFAIDPYTNLTVTPHVFEKVNPLLIFELERNFYSGYINVDASITRASAFDNDGDPFTDRNQFSDPTLAPIGKRTRSHFFAEGQFELDDDWLWGFGVQLASDDLYLNRYDLPETPKQVGLNQSEPRRLISQIYTLGQTSDYRFSASAYGYQSLFTFLIEDEDTPDFFTIFAEDDSTLPLVAPKIEYSHFFTDPILGGRIEAFSDITAFTRRRGVDYTRATGGVSWNKNFITPGGIEVKPFAEGRYDYYNFEIGDDVGPRIDPEAPPVVLAPTFRETVNFDRTLGQIGADIRWPFLKTGENVNWIVEPRAQVTRNFGDGRQDEFTVINTLDPNPATQEIILLEDSLDIDLDSGLLWSPNKSTGFDIWQQGFRADVGGSITALWGENNSATLFAGQSFASDVDDVFARSTGLGEDKSDLIASFELNLSDDFNNLRLNTRTRFDDDTSKFRRLDAEVAYSNRLFSANARYFKIDSTDLQDSTNIDTPPESISAGGQLNWTNNWSTGFTLVHDIEADFTRFQQYALTYQDDCTVIQFVYQETAFELDEQRNDKGFGIRFSFKTLGNFQPDT